MAETEPVHRRRRRERLTDLMVAALERRAKRRSHTDPELEGHVIRVPPKGSKGHPVSYAIAYDPDGKQVWARLGKTDVLGIEQARERARETITRVEAGFAPFPPRVVEPDTVEDVITTWLQRHVERGGLRTAPEMRRIAEKYILPHWRGLKFAEIRRTDVAKLLDAVEDAHGAWVADSVLDVLRNVASWQHKRDDTYTPPFVKGMRRVPKHARKRNRILSDDELRDVWRAAETAGTVGGFVRLLLLTAQRREKVAAMRWSDITPDGVWEITTEEREKGNAGALRLPEAALAIINAQPRLAGNDHIFAASRGARPLNGFAKRKAAFDKACGVTGWKLHDLRRTSRSLLSKAGVRPDIAERVLGHVIGGVEGVYDRHRYDDEKADALAKLANLIERIVSGRPSDNVVPLRPAAQP